jgi:hypothetical protein
VETGASQRLLLALAALKSLKYVHEQDCSGDPEEQSRTRGG